MEKWLFSLICLIFILATSTCFAKQAYITVKEESVIINKGTQWELGGTLSIPEGAKKPYPCVLLVQAKSITDAIGEYKIPGHMDKTVLKDISNWILAH